MSTLYNVEPQPTAKAVINTTSGDLTVELFAKQTPLASRNFLQHCLDGYYTGSPFHRLVPGFIIQGGDPTGTGQGGVSAIHDDGAPFADEFHSRLKFNRRGLLGMANEGRDSNGSQFFFTLGATPELQAKHTMFGRIEGDTIYNLMKMGEAELTEEESSERPMYPTTITGTEVLVNPFEDLAARTKSIPKPAPETSKRETKKRKKPAGKNVMSFGADDGGDEADVVPKLKKVKANPKLVSAVVESPATSEIERPHEIHHKTNVSASPSQSAKTIRTTNAEHSSKTRDVGETSTSTSLAQEVPAEKLSALEEINAEIEATKASLRRGTSTATKRNDKPRSALEAMIPATSTRGRKRGKAEDEKGALAVFKAFQQRLEDMPQPPTSASLHPSETSCPNVNGHADTLQGIEQDNEEEGNLCDLHFIVNCQSCRAWDEDVDRDDNDDGDDSWMGHALTFAKDTLGKDLEWKKKMDEIEVIDPREKERTIVGDRRGRRKELANPKNKK